MQQVKEQQERSGWQKISSRKWTKKGTRKIEFHKSIGSWVEIWELKEKGYSKKKLIRNSAKIRLMGNQYIMQLFNDIRDNTIVKLLGEYLNIPKSEEYYARKRLYEIWKFKALWDLPRNLEIKWQLKCESIKSNAYWN